MNKNRNIVFAVLLIGLLCLGGIFLYTSKEVPNPIPLSTEDKNIEWNFQASHNDNGPLEEKVRAEIKALEAKIGDGSFTDQEYFISIANQYSLVGEGKNAYRYLGKAIDNGGAESGLALLNMGGLLVRIGAKVSATVAYEKALLAMPGELSINVAYIEHLRANFPEDTAKIEQAFVAAELALPDNLSILQLRALWYKSEGKIRDAIAVLKKMRQLSPVASRSQIDREIAELNKSL